MFTQQKRKKEVLVLALLLSVLIVWGAKSASAKHVLLTIECTVSPGLLKSTYPLEQMHKDALSQGRRGTVFFKEKSTLAKREIEEALSQLEDGDILVLSVHSNSEKFGWGRTGLRWEYFWDTFLPRGTRRPRLSLVVIAGCIENVDPRTKQRTGATDLEMGDIREHLNAEAIIAISGDYNILFGRFSVRNFLQRVGDKDQEKKISQFVGVNEESSDGELSEWASHWRFVTAPVLDDKNATMAKLRETAIKRAASLVAEKETDADEKDREFQVEAAPKLEIVDHSLDRDTYPGDSILFLIQYMVSGLKRNESTIILEQVTFPGLRPSRTEHRGVATNEKHWGQGHSWDIPPTMLPGPYKIKAEIWGKIGGRPQRDTKTFPFTVKSPLEIINIARLTSEVNPGKEVRFRVKYEVATLGHNQSTEITEKGEVPGLGPPRVETRSRKADIHHFERTFTVPEEASPGYTFTATVSGSIRGQPLRDAKKHSFKVVESDVIPEPPEDRPGMKVYGSWKMTESGLTKKGKEVLLSGPVFKVKTLRILESESIFGIELLVNGMTPESWLSQEYGAANQPSVSVHRGQGNVSTSGKWFIYACNVIISLLGFGKQEVSQRWTWKGTIDAKGLNLSVTVACGGIQPSPTVGYLTVFYRGTRS